MIPEAIAIARPRLARLESICRPSTMNEKHTKQMPRNNVKHEKLDKLFSERIAFRHPDGSMQLLPKDTLLIGLDETGDWSHKDPHNPVFGIGGVITTARKYIDNIRDEWVALKKAHYPQLKGPFHATAVRNFTKRKSFEHVVRYFNKHDFGRFAAFSTPFTQKRKKTNPTEELIHLAIAQTARAAAKPYAGQFSIVCIVAESGSTFEHLLGQSLAKYTFQLTPQNRVSPVVWLVDKQQSFPLLELADISLFSINHAIRSPFRPKCSDIVAAQRLMNAPKNNVEIVTLETIDD